MEEGLSRIPSTIGKPLHVDLATTKHSRFDFARICIEVDANEDLPSSIHIKIELGSVVVAVEYQWLPQKCTKCNAFGHSCNTIPTTPNPNGLEAFPKPDSVVPGTTY